MWTCEEERTYQFVKSLIRRVHRITLTHGFEKIEFAKQRDGKFIRRDVFSGREVVETDVPPEAVVVAVFRALRAGWKICR